MLWLMGNKLPPCIDMLSSSSWRVMSLTQVGAGGAAVTGLYPGVWAWLLPLLAWSWALLTRPRVAALSSAVTQPPFLPPSHPRGPLEQPGDPWPAGSILPEMPRCSRDLSTKMTCVRNQSPAHCLAPLGQLTAGDAATDKKVYSKAAADKPNTPTQHQTAVSFLQSKEKRPSRVFILCLINDNLG